MAWTDLCFSISDVHGDVSVNQVCRKKRTEEITWREKPSARVERGGSGGPVPNEFLFTFNASHYVLFFGQLFSWNNLCGAHKPGRTVRHAVSELEKAVYERSNTCGDNFWSQERTFHAPHMVCTGHAPLKEPEPEFLKRGEATISANEVLC